MIRFDVDPMEIKELQLELGATIDQLRFAITRALQRTAKTLQKNARSALTHGLDLRRQNALRKRLKGLKIKRKGRGDNMLLTLWFGLNDLRVGDIKGSPMQTAEGAQFNGVKYPGAFVAKARSGKRTIFKRSGRGRFPIVEQTYPIADRAEVILEDEVYPDIADIFMTHLRMDLRARVNGFGMQTMGEARAKRKPRDR